MNTEPESSEGAPSVGRGYPRARAGGPRAARRLCLHQRVAELLHTSRRSVGRAVEADVTARSAM
jgi:hypothetical protein